MWESRAEGAFFKVEKFSGQGRTSRVFRAVRYDSRGHSRQLVALKLLKSDSALPWLRREFETLAKVNSPHCVRVLGWENLKEGSALVLDWIDGVNLLELSRSHVFDSALIEEIIAQVQEGLRALARLGLHHGDLSAANILIDSLGTVKIVDFGTLPAAEGVLYGTPKYMAPELWDGKDPSIESDLFALGLIAYDLRTGFQRWRTDIAQPSHPRDETHRIAASSPQALLSIEPSTRLMLDVKSCSKRRERLALGVRRLQAERTSILVKTMDFKFAPGLRRLLKCAFLVSVIAVSGFLPSYAEAPLLDAAELSSACLKINSLAWVHVAIGKRNLGYTPVEVRHLRSGVYELSWRSRFSAGRKRLFLPAGSCLELRDADFGLRH